MGAGLFTGISDGLHFLAEGPPNPGLLACRKVELIKNNHLPGVINVPWQSPITQQAQAACAATTDLLF